jgi:hypothetical protein
MIAIRRQPLPPQKQLTRSASASKSAINLTASKAARLIAIFKTSLHFQNPASPTLTALLSQQTK